MWWKQGGTVGDWVNFFYFIVWITVFHEYLAGIIFSEFVILEISRVFNLAIPKNRAG